ncbi:hypothetical protein GNI_054610 [Gregarina niphandrodes]|uniref:Uncharacterized protein n=1 Tax=Gregarina niphandrodes TaxID=110365 RepID=A0A023B944_GRENI|nr:hypothetical protein GNI_054610 [Gregarina niphandrodes]EZG70708.1 hypothetical protein GNI_054610 [Gregarina niphandrodes]|eukprot:XP_011129891.1 hypothetical protein GNI_054610 [Gregarina niphandrodes]
MRGTPVGESGVEWAVALLGVKVICPFWDDVSDDETLQLMRLSHLYALDDCLHRDLSRLGKMATVSVTVQSLRESGVKCALGERVLAKRFNRLTPVRAERLQSRIMAGHVPSIDTSEISPDSLDRMVHYQMHEKLRFTDNVLDYEFTKDAKHLAAMTQDSGRLEDEIFVALQMRTATHSKPEVTRMPVATSRPVATSGPIQPPNQHLWKPERMTPADEAVGRFWGAWLQMGLTSNKSKRTVWGVPSGSHWVLE